MPDTDLHNFIYYLFFATNNLMKGYCNYTNMKHKKKVCLNNDLVKISLSAYYRKILPQYHNKITFIFLTYEDQSCHDNFKVPSGSQNSFKLLCLYSNRSPQNQIACRVSNIAFIFQLSRKVGGRKWNLPHSFMSLSINSM